MDYLCFDCEKELSIYEIDNIGSSTSKSLREYI